MKHFRAIECAPGLIAYYDGRGRGQRWAKGPNWVDDGAISLGIASYALVNKNIALVYDTHVSVEHGQTIRDDLRARGVTELAVLLSHWHLDHVAGNEAFSDCEIISTRKTLDHLREHKQAIEEGRLNGPPAINPVILPSWVFEGEMEFTVGSRRVKFIECHIHSNDAAVVWIEEEGLLLAGDTMEDTITYVGEPEHFPTHLAELDRLWALKPSQIFPNHGDPKVIANGGYGRGLIKAQQQYIRCLQRCADDATLRKTPLKKLIGGPLGMGWVNYFKPYERVHQQNLERVLAHSKKPS